MFNRKKVDKIKNRASVYVLKDASAADDFPLDADIKLPDDKPEKDDDFIIVKKYRRLD